MDNFAEQFGLPGSEDWKPKPSELENLEGIQKENLPEALKENFSAGSIALMKKDALLGEDYELVKLLTDTENGYIDRFLIAYTTILSYLVTAEVVKYLSDGVVYYHVDYVCLETEDEGQLVKMYRTSAGSWRNLGPYKNKDLLKVLGKAIDQYETGS